MNHKSMVYSNPVHRIIKNHPLKLMTPLRNFKFPSFFSYFSHNHLNRLAHSIDQIAFHSSMLMKYQNYRSLLQYQIKSMIITRIFFIFPLIITLHITIIVSCDLPLPFTVLFTFFPFPFILTLPFLTTLFSYQLTTISSTNTSIYFHQSDQISQFHLDQNHKHFSLPSASFNSKNIPYYAAAAAIAVVSSKGLLPRSITISLSAEQCSMIYLLLFLD